MEIDPSDLHDVNKLGRGDVTMPIKSMKYRILIVDEAAQDRMAFGHILRQAGYAVTLAESGVQAMETVRQFGLPNLVLLEAIFSEISGMALAEKLHEIADVPVVFLSVVSDMSIKIAALSHHGDDYVTKPVEPAVLLARVKRVLGRFPGLGLSGQGIEIRPGIFADFDMRRAIADGRAVNFTPIESEILKILYDHRGQVVSHNSLHAGIMQGDSLYVHICRLRNKIEVDPFNPQILQTVYGKGYCLALA